MRYLFDFGDGWEHTIKVERIGGAESDPIYPRLTEATGRCPPEDVGGPPGYEEFLEAIAGPQHERHAEMREWCGGDIDPKAIHPEGHINALAALAQAVGAKARR